MPKSLIVRIGLFLTAALILGGCGRQTAVTEIPGPDQIATLAFQTVAAELTRIAEEASPTPTQPLPTPTIIPTDTPEPTSLPTIEPSVDIHTPGADINPEHRTKSDGCAL